MRQLQDLDIPPASQYNYETTRRQHCCFRTIIRASASPSLVLFSRPSLRGPPIAKRASPRAPPLISSASSSRRRADWVTAVVAPPPREGGRYSARYADGSDGHQLEAWRRRQREPRQQNLRHPVRLFGLRRRPHLAQGRSGTLWIDMWFPSIDELWIVWSDVRDGILRFVGGLIDWLYYICFSSICFLLPVVVGAWWKNCGFWW